MWRSVRAIAKDGRKGLTNAERLANEAISDQGLGNKAHDTGFYLCLGKTRCQRRRVVRA